jgi:hypothetical protein
MNDDLFPPLDQSLIKQLDELFPERCPDEDWTDRQIWIYVGQRNVVRMLRSVYLEQQDED